MDSWRTSLWQISIFLGNYNKTQGFGYKKIRNLNFLPHETGFVAWVAQSSSGLEAATRIHLSSSMTRALLVLEPKNWTEVSPPTHKKIKPGTLPIAFAMFWKFSISILTQKYYFTQIFFNSAHLEHLSFPHLLQQWR